MGRKFNEISDISKLIAPYVFKLPASPHLAAEFERKRIAIHKITGSLKILKQKFDFVIVEGTGGVLVPLDRKVILVDLVRLLDIPVLLVCPNKLGAINQALTAIEALKQKKLKILGIILINMPRQNRAVLEDNPDIIKKFSGVDILGVLPWNKDFRYLYRKFIPAAKKIKKVLQ
jgi:dethiobiotin synthetase